jgi:hypothetical protein
MSALVLVFAVHVGAGASIDAGAVFRVPLSRLVRLSVP